MFRRIQTHGLPGRPETAGRLLFWDFRRADADAPWTLELQAWASGAWRTPEQASWLRDNGLPVPQPKSALALDPAHLALLTEQLDPVSVVSWTAMELHQSAVDLVNQGQAREALAQVEALMGLAPSWDDARLLELTVLIQSERDADRAEAALHALPEGLIDPAQQRSLRQSIALLRKDWPAYAAEVRAVIDEGDTSWWHFEVLGLSLWAADELDAARAAFLEGLSHHPGHRALELRLVEVLDAAGQTDQAIATLDDLLAPTATEEGRAHAKTWALRGWLRRDRDPEGSQADTLQALALDQAEPVARVCRGVARMAAGDIDGARADLEPHSHCGWAAAAEAWNAFVALHGTDHDHPNHLVQEDAPAESCGLPHDHSHSHSHSHSH